MKRSSISARDRRLRRLYGITQQQYTELLHKQHDVCAICSRPPSAQRSLAVDHDHHTRKTRGLLCTYCNRYVIGRHTDWRLLLAASRYLQHPPAAGYGWIVPPKLGRKRGRK